MVHFLLQKKTKKVEYDDAIILCNITLPLLNNKIVQKILRFVLKLYSAAKAHYEYHSGNHTTSGGGVEVVNYANKYIQLGQDGNLLIR